MFYLLCIIYLTIIPIQVIAYYFMFYKFIWGQSLVMGP